MIMKTFYVLLTSLFMMVMACNSCTTYASASDGIYDDVEIVEGEQSITINVITTHGIPYYVDGVLIYYYYNDLYYYPFYYDDYLYYRAFYRPLRWGHRYHFGRPHYGDIGHRPGWINPGTQRPIRPHHGGKPHKPHDHHGGKPHKPHDHHGGKPGGHGHGHGHGNHHGSNVGPGGHHSNGHGSGVNPNRPIRPRSTDNGSVSRPSRPSRSSGASVSRSSTSRPATMGSGHSGSRPSGGSSGGGGRRR